MPQMPFYPLNQDVPAALVTLTAASVGANSADQHNTTWRGVVLTIDITALSGTSPTLTVTVQGKDPVSGAYYSLLVSAALGTTGLTILTLFPGAATTANVSEPQPLPATWRVITTIGGTSPGVTATVGASLIV